MILVFDRFVNGKPYPNLARHEAVPFTPEWRQFSGQWPHSEPFHFLEYLDQEGIPCSVIKTENAEHGLYPISLGFFDFSVDWFSLVDPALLEKARQRKIKFWFYYSEGDNPFVIDRRLTRLCKDYSIPRSQVHFTIANTAAEQLENFSYFPDDELLFRLRNQHWPPGEFFDHPRRKKFTALVRTHKWWRATSMARLWQQGLHQQGYFSYNSKIDIGNQETDNPIEVDQFSGLRAHTYNFLKYAPFRADKLTSDLHNEYSSSVPDHYSESYLHIVLETHFDTEQSSGVFLTEKTFKPIKFCQPFVILGAAGSIAQVKKMGYRTFDHVIDHSYDSISNNTKRWDAAMSEIERLITDTDLHSLFQSCGSDLIHNRQLFLSSKRERLNTLIKKVIS